MTAPKIHDVMMLTLKLEQETHNYSGGLLHGQQHSWKKYQQCQHAANLTALPSQLNSSHQKRRQSDIICHNCGRPGHFSQDCPHPRKNQQPPTTSHKWQQRGTFNTVPLDDHQHDAPALPSAPHHITYGHQPEN